ncbi:MAG: helix-turn-helix transcriptional regulator [Magnetococcus sp. YQC-3]
MNTLADRIKTERKRLGLTMEALGKRINVGKSAISQYESGLIKTMSSETLLALAKVFDVDPTWLATGKQPQNKHRIESTNNIYQLPSSNAQFLGGIKEWDEHTPLDDDEVALPFFREVKLSAGKGSTEVQENHGCKLRFAKSTLKRQGVQVEHAYCVTVKGNSMEPVLPDGCTVGIDTNNTTVKNGDWYAIDHHGELRVKLIYRLPGGGYRLRSFNNEEWPDEHIQEHDIKILGRVFWWSGLR